MSAGEDERAELISVTLADQLFGIPVRLVRDVLGPQRLTRIPRAAPEIAGALNLRGRIVTAIDLRRRLGLPPMPAEQRGMSIVVDQGGELYSLVVDSVGEVLSLDSAQADRSPPTLAPAWRALSQGIYRLERNLLIVLDVARVLDFSGRREAA
jgi:purine-binding chemotaxis protein CheW